MPHMINKVVLTFKTNIQIMNQTNQYGFEFDLSSAQLKIFGLNLTTLAFD